jgi:putative endonuclease
MHKRNYFVYIMSNMKRGVMYIGITSSLCKRVKEHKNKVHKNCFTAKYNLRRLVYFEMIENAVSAIHREKQIKKYPRKWKFNLIEKDNFYWKDLYKESCGLELEKIPQ